MLRFVTFSALPHRTDSVDHKACRCMCVSPGKTDKLAYAMSGGYYQQDAPSRGVSFARKLRKVTSEFSFYLNSRIPCQYRLFF
jgi:hypothetical protein